jgi:hypothetical protein
MPANDPLEQAFTGDQTKPATFMVSYSAAVPNRDLFRRSGLDKSLAQRLQ